MITQPQRYIAPYELDDDIDAGFRAAVENNQVSLALQYAVLLFARQDKRLFEMEEQLKEATSVKAATKTTTTNKSSSRRKQQDDEE